LGSTTCSIRDWLAARLAADYPLFQHRGGLAEANKLVGARDKVALILDGLDEMDVAWRPAALRALSDAPFRVVVLTRSQEMVQAAATAWLVGAVAVRLHYISGPEGADYLQRARTEPPPSGWTRLLTCLREHPGSVLARGLSTALALTLVRDTYRSGDDISELLDSAQFRTAEDIEQHLITRVLPDAYNPRPGRRKPPYSLPQAQQALTFLAQQMNKDRTRDLGWWQVSQWAPSRPRILISMLTGGLLGALLGALLSELVIVLVQVLMDRHALGLRYLRGNLLTGLFCGFGVGLPLGLGGGRGSREPKRVKTWRAINFPLVLATALAYGLFSGLSAAYVVYSAWLARLVAQGSMIRIPNPLFGAVVGLVIGLPFCLKRPAGRLGEGQSNPRDRSNNRHKNRSVGLVPALTFGLATALGAGLTVAFPTDHAGGTKTNLVSGLMVGLVRVSWAGL
jgi:hypothetical protein